MKREYFEMLWNACKGQEIGFLTNEEKSKIPKEIWNDWKKKRIIGYSTIPKEVFLPQYDLNLPARIERIENSDEVWAISQDAESGGRFKILKSEVELYAVMLEELINQIVKEWGIESALKEIPPKAIRIGIKDNEIPIIILYEIIGNPMIQAFEIQESLGNNKIILLRIGETNLTHSERKRLSENGISFWGSSEFISFEGEPKWDLEFIPKTTPVYVAGPWTYYPDTDTVSFNGEVLLLTPISKKIMGALIEKFDNIVTYEELIIAMYGISAVKENVYSEKHVTDRIYHLRKDLKKEVKAWIKNFPKQGYRLLAPQKK